MSYKCVIKSLCISVCLYTAPHTRRQHPPCYPTVLRQWRHLCVTSIVNRLMRRCAKSCSALRQIHLLSKRRMAFLAACLCSLLFEISMSCSSVYIVFRSEFYTSRVHVCVCWVFVTGLVNQSCRRKNVFSCSVEPRRSSEKSTFRNWIWRERSSKSGQLFQVHATSPFYWVAH